MRSLRRIQIGGRGGRRCRIPGHQQFRQRLCRGGLTASPGASMGAHTSNSLTFTSFVFANSLSVVSKSPPTRFVRARA